MGEERVVYKIQFAKLLKYQGSFYIIIHHHNLHTMRNRDTGILYSILGIYTLLISWHYNHSIILLIIHYIIWPVYLVYELLIGHLSHDLWKTIPASYFN